MTGWTEMLAAYDAALAAEREYDDAHVASVDTISAKVSSEIQRLMDLRTDLEMPLMAHPSPDARAFARKFLIAHGGGREADYWNDMLEAEAKRFATPDDPHLALFRQRDPLLASANVSFDEEVTGWGAIEHRILDTPASTLEGSLIRLLVIAQLLAHGNVLDNSVVRPIADEAARHLGCMTLDELNCLDPVQF